MRRQIIPAAAWLAFVATLTVLGLALLPVVTPPQQRENWIWRNEWPGERQPRPIDTCAQEAEDTETPHSGKFLPD